jgi:hypothetical protein
MKVSKVLAAAKANMGDPRVNPEGRLFTVTVTPLSTTISWLQPN